MPGKKPHKARNKKTEKFKMKHPEGRKAFSKKRKMERLKRYEEQNLS